MIFCQHQDYCGGCQYTDRNYHEELAQKTKSLSEMLSHLNYADEADEIEVLSLDGRGQRCRSDLSLQQGRLGFYQSKTHDVFDLIHCEHWSSGLTQAFDKFKRITLPFQKASFRIRESPTGAHGLWMDLSNLDVKKMLETTDLVEEILASFSHVEVGQKFKKLVIEDRPRLRESAPAHWFQTHMGAQLIALHGYVGSFTQPSLVYNDMICKKVEELATEAQAESILEFGAGIGNLSFPLLGQSRKLVALESSIAALTGFEQTLTLLPEQIRADVSKRLTLMSGDFQSLRASEHSFLNSRLATGLETGLDTGIDTLFDTIFCNPPRSGLMHFTNTIINQRPKNLIYMSCYPESMLKDISAVTSANYKIKYVGLIDQFPRSKHFESLLWLQQN